MPNDTEVEQEIARLVKLAHPQDQGKPTEILEQELRAAHHHQLQKAREEAVSKERGRIEIELMSTESHSHPGEPGLFKAWSDIRKVINNKNV